MGRRRSESCVLSSDVPQCNAMQCVALQDPRGACAMIRVGIGFDSVASHIDVCSAESRGDDLTGQIDS